MAPFITGVLTAKIARNAVFFGCILAGYEGALIARQYGVDIEKLAEALSGDAASGGGLAGALMLQLRPNPAGNPQEAAARENFHRLMIKDVGVAIKEAARFGATLPLADLVIRRGKVSVGLVDPSSELLND